MSEAPQEEYPDVEMLSEVVMAVTLTDRGAIGCAYYVARNETLYFMEDVQMGDANMVDACKSPKADRLLCTTLTARSEAVY
jgi:DNA mismatch repair protein MSH5